MAETLENIRKKYPQYADMPDAALADAIHKKFYADMPRADFDAKVGIKPQAAPVTMDDPGFFGRINQRMKQQYTDQQAPVLPADAGTGARIGDTIMDGSDYLKGLADTMARGFTFGLSDDVNAAGLAMTTDKSFSEANALENQKIREFKEANPVVGNTAEIAAGVASPFGRIGSGYISQGGNIGTRALRSIPAGIGLGGLSGLGYSEGGIGDRVAGMAGGAALGGVLAPIASAGTETLLNLGGKVINTGRNILNAHRDPTGQANKLLAQAVARDGLDPSALRAAAGNDVDSLMNAGGQRVAPNLTGLGRQATVAPGNARMAAQDFIEGQQAGQVDRTAQVLSDLIPENADDEIARLAVSKQRTARPLYKAAYDADPETLATPYVREVLDSDTGRQALKEARVLWQQDKLAGRVDGSDPFTPMLDAEGNLTLQTAPDMRILDYMKRGMDKMTDAAFKASATAGNSMKAVRDAFRDHLKEINPAYRDALNAYSGPSHVQDLITEGMDFLKGRSQEKLARIAKLQGDDLSAYRIGAVRSYLDRLDKVTDAGDVYAAMGNSPEKRKLLAALFPTRAEFDRVTDQLLRERARVMTARGVGGNSITSRLDAEKSDAADSTSILRTVGDALNGNMVGGLLGLATRSANPARGITEPVADELGRILFTADPATKQRVVQGLLGLAGAPGLLQQTTQQLARTAARQRNLGGLLGALTGQASGAAVGSVR